jgi:uncharacterized tellurite resistance protein B-like protein
MSTLSLDERRSHLRNLVALAAKDGVIRDEERAVLVYVAGRMGLSDTDMDDAINRPDEIHMSFPADRTVSFHQLYDLTEMMIIDGEVRKVERELCTSFAIRLGFKPEDINVVIQAILTGNRSGASEEDIRAGLLKKLVG